MVGPRNIEHELHRVRKRERDRKIGRKGVRKERQKWGKKLALRLEGEQQVVRSR